MAASTTPLIGTGYALQISTDAGTTYKLVRNVQSVSFDLTTGEAETSGRDVCGFGSFKPTRTNGTLSFETLVENATVANYLNTHELVNLQLAQTTFLWKFCPVACGTADEVVGEYEFKGSGFLTGMPLNTSNDEAAKVSGSIRVTGAFTHTVIV